MFSENFDCAYDMLSDLLWEDKETDKNELYQRVLSKFRLTNIEKAELYNLVLLNYDD